MSPFKHSYSGLITKGLGGPACCGLLTMGFHLFFCKLEIIISPTPIKEKGIGSAGSSLRDNIIPRRIDQEEEEDTKQTVRFTISFKGSQPRVHEYLVSPKNAKLAVKVINTLNTTAQKISTQLSPIVNITKKVSAAFAKTDK